MNNSINTDTNTIQFLLFMNPPHFLSFMMFLLPTYRYGKEYTSKERRCLYSEGITSSA